MPRVFVTVGSTQIDDLVKAALSDTTLEALRRKGYDELVVQCGKLSDAPAIGMKPENEGGPWSW